jgi:hypothetical protein
MAYARTTTVDTGPAGDTIVQGVTDLDTDLTAIYANLNTHEALTETHGATGEIVGTTNTQTLTNKTLTSPTISGGTITSPTISSLTQTVSASTSNKVMSASDMGKVWTNTGAEVAIYFTLPEASTVLGKSVTFVVTVEHHININPNDGTDKIIGLTNAAGDAITSSVIGNTITLTSVGNDLWAVTAEHQDSEFGWQDVN